MIEQICVSDIERDTIRPHPSTEGAVLVTAQLSPAPSNLWKARFSQALLTSPNFGRVELGPNGASVNITVGRDEQVADRLDELAALVEQTNAEVAEEQARLDTAAQLRRARQEVDVERVRRDVDALDT